MALTADDINNVSFSIDRKGYDVDEVDVFLEHVAAEVDAMNSLIADLERQLADARENAVVSQESAEAVEEAGEVDVFGETASAQNEEIAALESKIADLEARLAEKTANDSAISQALIVAQRSADEIVANARAQASNIVKDADEEADRIIGKAESDRLKIADSIRLLENDRSEVRAGYREMLSSFMADAQRKLAEIDGDSRRANAASQARYDANASSYSGTAAAEPRTPNIAPAAAPAPTPTGYVEKDFSGYGDAASDFGFDVD